MPHPSEWERVTGVLQAWVDIDIARVQKKLKELEEYLCRLQEERRVALEQAGALES